MKSVLYYKERFYDHIHTVHKPTYYDIIPGRRSHSVIRRRIISPLKDMKPLDPVSVLRSNHEDLHLYAAKIMPFKFDIKPNRKKVLSMDGKLYEKFLAGKNNGRYDESPATDRAQISRTPMPIKVVSKKCLQMKPALVRRSQSTTRKSLKMKIKVSPERLVEDIQISSWEQSPHELRHVY